VPGKTTGVTTHDNHTQLIEMKSFDACLDLIQELYFESVMGNDLSQRI
jgi:hypothetical protein